MGNEKISDLVFRKVAVTTAFALIVLLITMNFVDHGVDYLADLKALNDHYSIFPLLFGAGTIGIMAQVFCLKTAIETHKIYTLISILVFGYISFLFLREYEIVYQYMDLSALVSDCQAGLIPIEQVMSEVPLISETADAVYQASTYLIAYGVIQFIIGLIPDAWMMKLSDMFFHKENEVQPEIQHTENRTLIGKEVVQKAFLVCQTNNERIAINNELTIGRSESCAYVIRDQYLNPLHARIVKKGDTYVLIDCQTTNRTYLNDTELVGEQEYLLKHGDEITMADVEFRFVIETEGSV